MRQVIWTMSLAALCLGVVAGPASAQTIERQRREARIERQERVRHRMAQRREALRERRAEARSVRREIKRQRAELRRDVRRRGR